MLVLKGLTEDIKLSAYGRQPITFLPFSCCLFLLFFLIDASPALFYVVFFFFFFFILFL
jgi:hypothetical protein